MLFYVLVCGCAQVAPQKPTDIQITCKPKFELESWLEIHVTDSEGNRQDAFRQWLILDDGKQRFRIPWGSPPLSRGPVALHAQQTYAFTIKMETEQETRIPRVIRVQQENEVIYEARD